MLPGWRRFKQFLTAEEVPRWFGLSLVLIYLVGLGSVARFGIAQARLDSAVHYQRGGQYAVKLLSQRLSTMTGANWSDRKLLGAYQRALREFATNIPIRFLRVVSSEGRIVASTNTTEIGTTISAGVGVDWPAGLMHVLRVEVAGRDKPDLLIRMRLAAHVRASPAPEGVEDTDSPASPLDTQAGGRISSYVEARFPPEPPGGAGLANQARTLAMVLVVLGALFVVYRCLREQLRAVSRIAGRLQVHRDRLEDELGSLRIGDALGGVTATWNELVDLTQRLLDTVQRSQANEELSRVLQRAGGGALAGALNAVPDGIVYLADEVRFEYLNSAALHFFGWTEDQAKGLTLPDAQTDGIAGEVLALLRDALQPDGSYEARTELLAADEEDGGDRSAYRVWAIPLRRAQHHGECVVIIRDVSQNIRADRAREEFITQVTHELRTPLTNIRAYAETLSSGMFDDPNVITECYNVITKETRRLSRLIEDILNVSQLEVGTIELQMGSVDLKTLLTEGVRDVRGLADDRHIDIQLALPSKVEPIHGDRDKLAVVVNNLLGNAIKYTQANGHVVVGCQFAGEEAIITVKDNGIGIDPADHARIFEKFQRVLDPEVQSETGTGIGLYTAREIARHHRGDIELISEKGKGSTFLVRLPHQESRAAAITTVEEA